MHWFPVAALSALAFGLAGFFMKASQMRGGALSSLLLGLYAAGTLGFWLQALLAGSWQPLDRRVWLAGAVIGIGSAWGNLLFMRALACGPASLVSPLTGANIVIVMAAGIVWFGEQIHPASLIGALWLLAGIGLLSLRTPGRSPSAAGGAEPAASPAVSSTVSSAVSPAMSAAADRRWYGLALAAMLLFVLRNGGLKVTDRIGLDSASVLWAGYLLSWLWFAIVAIRNRSASPDGRATGSAAKGSAASGNAATDFVATGSASTDFVAIDFVATGSAAAETARARTAAAKSARVGWRWGLAAGVFSYGGLQLYAEALARGPSHLVAPIFAANSLVVVVLSLILYRERLSVPQYVALFCLLAGLVMIRL